MATTPGLPARTRPPARLPGTPTTSIPRPHRADRWPSRRTWAGRPQAGRWLASTSEHKSCKCGSFPVVRDLVSRQGHDHLRLAGQIRPTLVCQIPQHLASGWQTCTSICRSTPSASLTTYASTNTGTTTQTSHSPACPSPGMQPDDGTGTRCPCPGRSPERHDNTPVRSRRTRESGPCSECSESP
jgi:hypothetical protein